MHRWQPTDEILEQITGWVIADNRARYLFRKNNRFYRPACNVYSFFNDSRWHDEIPSLNDDDRPQGQKQICECGQEGKYRYMEQLYCITCYDKKAHPNFKREVYNRLVERGLGKKVDETREQYLGRLRTTGMQSLARIQKGAMALSATERPRTRSTVAAGETVQSENMVED